MSVFQRSELPWTVLRSAILWVPTAQPHEGQSRVPARQITAPNQSDYPARADTPAHIWAACSDSLARLAWQQRSQSLQLCRKSILSGDVGGSGGPHLPLSARGPWSKAWTGLLATCNLSWGVDRFYYDRWHAGNRQKWGISTFNVIPV